MDETTSGPEGWRERKRRETLQRITDAALDLFAAHGYEATTLDAIAETAGISRRTFFHYFKTKEDILAAWQTGLPEAFRAAILAQTARTSPFDTLRAAQLEMIALVDAERALTIDRIIRSSEQLRAANLAKYLLMEEVAFETLARLWPQPERRDALRMAAAAAVTAMRVALDAWALTRGRTKLADHLNAAFDALKAELSAG